MSTSTIVFADLWGNLRRHESVSLHYYRLHDFVAIKFEPVAASKTGPAEATLAILFHPLYKGTCLPVRPPAFSANTTAEEVASAFSTEIQGKNVLITGTSINGIGFEAARVVAKHASLVIITGCNAERLKLSEEAIKKEFPDANIRRLTLDLGSLAGVRKAAAEVNAYEEPLHVLIHNAAAAIGPFKLTPEGLESQIATDHIGPFLLTKLLTPKLLASTSEMYTPRVVFVSSEAHAASSGVDLATIEIPDAETMRTVFIPAVRTFIVIPSNMLQKEESVADMQAIGLLGQADQLPNAEKFPFKTIPQGAATMVAAAFDPRIGDQSGAYLSDSTVAIEAVAAHSSDPVTAERLWTTTEKIIGETFTF